MPSTRYAVRLPPALEADVQEHLRTTGSSFAAVIRHALAAYLAAPPPTAADSADRIRELETQMAKMTTRVKVIEEILTQWPQLVTRTADTTPTPRDPSAHRTLTPADRRTDRAPTGADTPPPPRRGRRPSPLRQQILALLQRHPEGLRAEEIRVYVQARRPIGDSLQGMVKGGVITGQGRGLARRYVVTAAYEAQRLGP